MTCYFKILVLLATLPAVSTTQLTKSSSPAPDQSTATGISLRLRATINRPRGDLLALMLSPNAKVLAAATADKQTELWNVETDQIIAKVDGRVVVLSYGDVRLLDAFSPDGVTLVTVAGSVAKLWDTATGRLRQTLSGHRKDIRATAFTPDGKILATGSADGTVRLWSTETGALQATLAAFQVKDIPRWRILARVLALRADISIYFSPDGRRLLTVPFSQATKLWNVATGRLEYVLGQNNSDGKFSPSGRFVLTFRHDVTGNDLWETATGRLLSNFPPSFEAAFSPDEQWLGFVEHHGKKGLFSLRSMRIEKPLDLSPYFVSWTQFSPDSRLFVVASGLHDHSAMLVEVNSGRVIANIPIVAKRGFDIISDYLKYTEALAFHPNSRMLMGANQDLVRFWDTSSGQLLKETKDGREPATFSADGKLIAAAGRDQKSIMFWAVTP